MCVRVYACVHTDWESKVLLLLQRPVSVLHSFFCSLFCSSACQCHCAWQYCQTFVCLGKHTLCWIVNENWRKSWRRTRALGCSDSSPSSNHTLCALAEHQKLTEQTKNEWHTFVCNCYANNARKRKRSSRSVSGTIQQKTSFSSLALSAIRVFTLVMFLLVVIRWFWLSSQLWGLSISVYSQADSGAQPAAISFSRFDGSLYSSFFRLSGRALFLALYLFPLNWIRN